jgi:hypothetical protein
MGKFLNVDDTGNGDEPTPPPPPPKKPDGAAPVEAT